MACNSKGLLLFHEEKLSETVRNFPVLYDKSKKGFKERDAVRTARTEVARSLDFIENWDDAKTYSKISKYVTFFSIFGCTKVIRCPNLSGVIRKHGKIVQNCFTCYF